MANSGAADTEHAQDADVPARTPVGRRAAPMLAFLSGVFLTIGAILVALLVLEWFAAVFTIWTPVVYEEDEVRLYEATASACLLSLAASLVLALLAHRRGLAWSAAIIFVVGLITALVFSVPPARWTPDTEPTREPLPSNYEPCYSGSNDCGGGG